MGSLATNMEIQGLVILMNLAMRHLGNELGIRQENKDRQLNLIKENKDGNWMDLRDRSVSPDRSRFYGRYFVQRQVQGHEEPNQYAG